MEKASVTVKSLGYTSGAYIYSMYESSSQRLNDMKSFVPSLNMPNVSMPTMRYPPMGQLATRMRSGMDSMFIQFREFCGSSDVTHTASMADIEAHMSANNAVGNNAYIMGSMGPSVAGTSSGGTADQMMLGHPSNVNHTYYQRFLQMIREEHNKRAKSKKTPLHPIYTEAKITEEDEDVYESYSEDDDSDAEERRQGRLRIPRPTTTATCLDENAPTTSAYATASSSSGSSSLEASALAEKESDLPQVVLAAKLDDSNVVEEEKKEDTEASDAPRQQVSRANSLTSEHTDEQEVKMATTSI
jgi:hypothetical protein